MAVTSMVMAADTGYGLRQAAEAVRKAEIKVGQEYSLDPMTGRFHHVHTVALSPGYKGPLQFRCDTCHTTERYPDDFLYLRKVEFPYDYKGMKVMAVQRQLCIGCHSGGSIATVFYNPKQ